MNDVVRVFLCLGGMLVPVAGGSAVLSGCSGQGPDAPDLNAQSAPVAEATPAGVQAPVGGAEDFNPRLLRRFRALRPQIDPAEGAPSEQMVQLGRMLYHEKRLSRNQEMSCNTCHVLDNYGVDNQPTSAGHKGKRGGRNSPTVFHAAGQFAQFWDGRAGTIEEQATGPILNPIEMGMPDPGDVVAILNSIPGYVEAFTAAFPGEKEAVSIDHVGRAIGAFERRLVTPSRWDRFVSGDAKALTAPEIDGLKVFTDIGCMVCHTGEYVGGAMFQKVGSIEAWPNQKDQGRYEVTKKDEDRMMFKVPTLRNVAKTGPYFHDGSAATLEEAVRIMGKHQLGVDLSGQEIKSIVTWLGSLTGELPRELIAMPNLPPDGPTTQTIVARLIKSSVASAP